MKVVILASTLALAGCAASTPAPDSLHNSEFTQGNVQLNLKVGLTTKAEVLEKFGSPNITTRDGAGQEVWSYQKMATVSKSTSSSSYWTILLTGQSKSADGFSQSSRTMTLIIKFDGKDIVSDFLSRTSDF